ncbi:MAG: hypothetical protein Pg6B_01570 [Candidatus Azobacteroides pseudotrichonymphae]|jgi:hypothetical protein|nr:MAG: hypothetical protein Pg6B_01570 [Candidatus Azobacteroides pseudotrichonymphae]
MSLPAETSRIEISCHQILNHFKIKTNRTAYNNVNQNISY